MYVSKCVKKCNFTQALATALVLLACAGMPAQASPSLRVDWTKQCPVSLESTNHPKIRPESTGLGAAVLTSVADTLIDAGITWVKTTFDPSNNEFYEKRSFAIPGLFDGVQHYQKLNCLMIAVFDEEESVQAKFPLSTPPQRAVVDDAAFIQEDSVEERLTKAFADMKTMKPLLYVELVRDISPDGSAHYYKPVYAYAAKVIRPHFLSKEPIWEISIGWTDPALKAISAWNFKFGGTPPFESREGQLTLLGPAWVPLRQPPSRALTLTQPFNMEVEIKEHRSPTLFANALKKAVDDNAATTKKLIQDTYPWRQQEVAAADAAALARLRDEVRQKAQTYLVSLQTFKTKCPGNASDPIIRAGCGLDLMLLQISYDAIKVDVDKYKLMPNGVDFPAPPTSI